MSVGNREWSLGPIVSLTLTVTMNALWGFLIIWVLTIVLLIGFGATPVGIILLAGFLVATIHFASELLHQIGHAIAARRTGYPMSGIRFGTFLVFATSLYPNSEPLLPANVHIRRALGGAIMSISIGLVAGLVLWLGGSRVSEARGLALLLAQIFFLDNLLLLGLGAFLPLGFTDGSTIYHYWRHP